MYNKLRWMLLQPLLIEPRWKREFGPRTTVLGAITNLALGLLSRPSDQRAMVGSRGQKHLSTLKPHVKFYAKATQVRPFLAEMSKTPMRLIWFFVLLRGRIRFSIFLPTIPLQGTHVLSVHDWSTRWGFNVGFNATILLFFYRKMTWWSNVGATWQICSPFCLFLGPSGAHIFSLWTLMSANKIWNWIDLTRSTQRHWSRVHLRSFAKNQFSVGLLLRNLVSWISKAFNFLQWN